MKTRSIILSLIMLCSFIGLSAQNKKDDRRNTVIFNVPMDCQSCKNKIEKNIAFEKGVKDLDVNLEKQIVSVTYDTKKTDVEKLQSAFGKLGYKATTSCCKSKEAVAACPKAKEECVKKAEGNQCGEHHGHSH